VYFRVFDWCSEDTNHVVILSSYLNEVRNHYHFLTGVSGRFLSCTLIAAAIFAAMLTPSRGAEARVFIGFGFGFPGFVGPPIYGPPPVIRPAPAVYVPPPPPVKHYRRPVRHYRPCRCYGS
jgi:hypothetical protein